MAEPVLADLVLSSDFQSKLPIFHQKWWLDIVAPGTWRYVLAAKGNFIGVWPVLSVKKFGFRLSKMPPLTPYLGPWICFLGPGENIGLGAEIEVHEKLIEELPGFDAFKQRFHPGVRQWLAFYWKGFCQTTRYTFRIDTGEDHAALWEKLSGTRRQRIRKGKKYLRMEGKKSVDEEFFQLVKATYLRRNMRVPFAESVLRDICEKSIKRNRGEIFYAVDVENGEKAAVMFLVWDRYFAYYLVGAYRDGWRDGSALSFLLWQGVLLAREMGLGFDFEGSMVRGINNFFRSFGGQLVPYFEISKVNSSVLKFFYALR